MIQAQHKPFFVWFFNRYSSLMLHHSFRKVTIFDGNDSPAGPLLMIGNHFSWWDGFIASYLNWKVFKRRLHIMMLEEELRDRIFLSKAGAFSIKKGSRGVLQSLEYTAGLLQDEGNLVVLYPQGEFQTLYAREIKFERGIMRLLDANAVGLRVVFYAALIDFFEHRKPHLNIYLQTADPEEFEDIGQLERSYTDFLNKSVSCQFPLK